MYAATNSVVGGTTIINFDPTTGELVDGNYSYFSSDGGATWTKRTDFYIVITDTTVTLNAVVSSGTLEFAVLCTTE